jgi:hypothetical protein
MCDQFSLKSCTDDTLLTFSGAIPRGLTGDDAARFRVTMHSAPVHAELDVYVFHPVESWSEFFTDLASNWMGWDGVREIASLEGEIHLACTTERGGHVNVRVFLTGSWPDDWRVVRTIHLEAGQLEAIARQARRYFG